MRVYLYALRNKANMETPCGYTYMPLKTGQIKERSR